MPKIKVGDRVKVAPIAGEVVWTGPDATTGIDSVDVRVKVDGPALGPVIEFVPACYVTVVPPPVVVPAVLDVLTHYTIKALPHGSVVISAGGLAAQLRISEDGTRTWYTVGDGKLSDATVAAWPAHVLHIGGTR